MLKRFLRLCSIILSLVMLVNMLPLNAVAEEYFSATADSTAKAPASGVRIVEEIVENRTEFSGVAMANIEEKLSSILSSILPWHR